MIQAGDVVTTDFMGATGLKRRPCVVLSSTLYHSHRPDVILAIVTSQIRSATTPTDCVLQDWTQAGLTLPSAVRAFIQTQPAASIRVIGHLTERDWSQVQTRIGLAFSFDDVAR